MARTFVIGDMHGAYKALLECLKYSEFNYAEDTLICLGDVADGYPEVRQCFDELLKIKNLKFIIGNHDDWMLGWISTNDAPDIWTKQGGAATLASYGNDRGNVPAEHEKLLREAAYIYVDALNRCFVHGGIDPNQKYADKQKPDLCMWDRDLVRMAKAKAVKYETGVERKQSFKWGGYEDIFVGHTSTNCTTGLAVPVRFCNVWMLDTGAGWEGRLTIMNVDTKEFWQSAYCPELYSGHRPRG